VNGLFLTSKSGRQVLPSFIPVPNFPASFFRRMYVPLKIRNIGGSAVI